MKFPCLESLTVAFLLLVPHTLAQNDSTVDPDGNTIGNPFCLKDHQLSKYGQTIEPHFASSSTNVCGHCVTNFTCVVPFTDERGNPSIQGTDDPDVYANNAISASDIFLALQTMLQDCNPSGGVCGVQWVSEQCFVQTYFAKQILGTDCPDSPCPDGGNDCGFFSNI